MAAFRIVRAEVVLAMSAPRLPRGRPAHHVRRSRLLQRHQARRGGSSSGLAREFPGVTYDVTIKVEHLLKHARHLPLLRDTGCAFVTSAVESIDDDVLAKLEKGHTRADFERVVALCREARLPLAPTFVPFTPWTIAGSYPDLLHDHRRAGPGGERLPLPAGGPPADSAGLADAGAARGPCGRRRRSIRRHSPTRGRIPTRQWTRCRRTSTELVGVRLSAPRRKCSRRSGTPPTSTRAPLRRAARCSSRAAPRSRISMSPGIVEPNPPQSSWL